ncbi:MAG TPA: hypothetical protein VGS17_03780, partial [Candidatus Limnocylindria bacterium]|nr:hypothetical protein [Candidatus Limnocylindria bacterium]
LAVGRAIREARLRALAGSVVVPEAVPLAVARRDRGRLIAAIVAVLALLLLLLLFVITRPAPAVEQGGGGDTAPAAAAAAQVVGPNSRGRSSADATPPPLSVVEQPAETPVEAPVAAIAPVGAPNAGSGTRAGGGGSGGGTGTGSGPGTGSGSGPGTGVGTPTPATPPPPPPPPPPVTIAPPFFAPPPLALAPVKPGFTRVIFYVADDETSAWLQGVCVGWDHPDCGSGVTHTDGYGRWWQDLYPDPANQYWNFQFLLAGFQPTVVRVDQHGGTTTIIRVRLAHAR